MARPNPIKFKPYRLHWRRNQFIDVVTGAPQKLFRHLRDGLRSVGYREIRTVSPHIAGQAITDTGTTKGMIIGEKDPIDIQSPWLAIRVGGAVLLILGLVMLLWVIMSSWDNGSPLAFIGDQDLLLWFIVGVVLIVVGGAMVRLHRYRSNLIWIDVQGEVYRSALSLGTDLQARSASSNRLSIISELRLAVKGCSVVSKNSGKRREILKMEGSSDLAWEFDNLMHNIRSDILPKVVLQKSRDMRRQEIESEVLPPPPPETVERQVVCVICKYCDGLVPQGSTACPSCGATSYF